MEMTRCPGILTPQREKKHVWRLLNAYYCALRFLGPPGFAADPKKWRYWTSVQKRILVYIQLEINGLRGKRKRTNPQFWRFVRFGSSSRTWTYDPLINSQVLWPTELLRKVVSFWDCKCMTISRECKIFLHIFFGEKKYYEVQKILLPLQSQPTPGWRNR